MERNFIGKKKHTIPSLVRIAVGARQRRRNWRSKGVAIDDVAAVLEIKNN